MSIRPHRARMASAAAWASSGRAMSAATAIVSPPLSRATASATAASDSPSPKAVPDAALVPWTATRAPSPARCAATTRPIPRDDPVTHATLPARCVSILCHLL